MISNSLWTVLFFQAYSKSIADWLEIIAMLFWKLGIFADLKSLKKSY